MQLSAYVVSSGLSGVCLETGYEFGSEFNPRIKSNVKNKLLLGPLSLTICSLLTVAAVTGLLKHCRDSYRMSLSTHNAL